MKHNIINIVIFNFLLFSKSKALYEGKKLVATHIFFFWKGFYYSSYSSLIWNFVGDTNNILFFKENNLLLLFYCFWYFIIYDSISDLLTLGLL
jgi:hypothetical protein